MIKMLPPRTPRGGDETSRALVALLEGLVKGEQWVHLFPPPKSSIMESNKQQALRKGQPLKVERVSWGVDKRR